jgi:hypothetical protein
MAFSTIALSDAINGALGATSHAQLHTGAAGSAGTSNVAAGVARAIVNGVGGAAGASDTLTGTWTINGAGGPFSHYSLWTASTGGTVRNTGELSPAESFEGPGTLDFTINVSAT